MHVLRPLSFTKALHVFFVAVSFIHGERLPATLPLPSPHPPATLRLRSHYPPATLPSPSQYPLRLSTRPRELDVSVFKFLLPLSHYIGAFETQTESSMSLPRISRGSGCRHPPPFPSYHCVARPPPARPAPTCSLADLFCGCRYPFETGFSLAPASRPPSLLLFP